MKRGFTLIELLVVIAIIGILSGIVITPISLARPKAYDSNRLNDMRTIKTALEFYYLDHGHFPCIGDTQSIQYPGVDDPHFLEPLVTGGYLSQSIFDPVNNNTFNYNYGTLKAVEGGPCGQIAVISFNRQADNTPCPEGQYRPDYPYDNHCHILYPTPAPATACPGNPYLVNPHINGGEINPQSCEDLFDLEYCDYNQTTC